MLYDGGEPTLPADQEQTEVRNGPAKSSQAPADNEQAPTVRTTLAGEPTNDAWLAHPFAMELRIHVVDPFGVPVQGYRPQLAPPNGALRYAKQGTDDEGHAVVTWNARQPRVEVEILDPRRHRRRIVLEHGKPTHVTLLHAPQSGQRLVTSSGTRLRFLSNISSQMILPERTNGSELGLGVHPYAQFGERALVPIRTEREDLANNLSLVLGELDALEATSLSQAVAGTTHALGEVEFQLHRANEAAAPACVVEGTVFGEDGQPCAEVPVLAFGSGPQPLQRTRTDNQGRYRIEGLAAGDGGQEGVAGIGGHSWTSSVEVPDWP